MFSTLRNVFKTPDLRKKILYTVVMIAVIRLGAWILIPGMDASSFISLMGDSSEQASNFFNLITGGSVKMTIFALGVGPYITSSIVMNLLTIAIPKLEELQKEGEDGKKIIASITRYVTVLLAIIEGTGIMISANFNDYRVADMNSVLFVIVGVIALTAGSAFTMWIGEKITEKGIGNGISIILVVNILSRIPYELKIIWNTKFVGESFGKMALYGLICVAFIVFMVGFVVLLQDAERRIPAQYAKRVQGRKMVGGQSTHIPMKVNTAGVIPVIFAMSLLSFPSVVAGFFPTAPSEDSFWGKVINALNQNNWNELKYCWMILVYILLIIAFAYFYTSITFNPIEVANNLKKNGGFIPGVRPGKPTVEYLKKVTKYTVFIGAMGLIVVAIIPILIGFFNVPNISFTGTSVIIIVGVIIETVKQAESQLLVRHYRGFLNAK